MNEEELDIRTGDIIRCQKIKVQKYNEYPQLTGNSGKCPLVVFRQNRDFMTGIPNMSETTVVSRETSATVAASSAAVANSSDSSSSFRRLVGGDASSTSTIVDTATTRDEFKRTGGWSVMSLKPDYKFQQRDVDILQMLSRWAETMFYSISLADDVVPHATLHGILTHLHKKVHSGVYASISPQVNPLFSNANCAPLLSERCDVVCMVAESLPPVESGGCGRLLLWDGTTNGMLALSTQAQLHTLAIIHTSLRAANEYSGCVSATDVGAAKVRVAAHNSSTSGNSATYVGCALEARASDPGLDGFLSRFRPGMWIRIRNLHLDMHASAGSSGNDPSVVYATVHADTHVCLLYPYFQ